MGKWLIIPFIGCMIFLNSCSNGETNKELDYEQTKKMVVDILQTDEGKQTFREIITDDKMKQHLIMDSEDVKNAISDTLQSDKSKKMWKELFADPEFVTSFADSLNDEQQKLMKQLMNDATFQKQMMDLLKDPEMSKQTIQLLKSQQFKEHLEKTILETLNSPIFQAKMQNILQESGDKKDEESSDEQTNKSGEEGSGGSEKQE